MRYWERGNPHIYLETFKQAATNLSLWMLLVVFLISISNRAAHKPLLREVDSWDDLGISRLYDNFDNKA